MLKNTELKNIGEALQDAGNVLLFPHVGPDSDAIGSCVALCIILRKLGKEAWILTEKELPYQLTDLGSGYCTQDPEIIGVPDIAMTVDCSEEKRFPDIVDVFRKGRKRVSIDHHMIEKCDSDLYYIDPEAAATAELIFELARTMDWPVDEECAEALYTGIVTDTGSFQHSNTTPETHRIAAELIEKGADVNEVSIRLFQNVDPAEIAVETSVMSRVEIFADGRAVISTLSQDDLRECGANLDHAEFVIDSLTRIRGAEIAAMLKEGEEGIRVSLRAKTCGDVAVIARRFGGGGHIKAAGCTLHMTMDEAVAEIKKAVEESFIVE